MTDDDVKAQIQRMLAAQAAHRELMKDVTLSLAQAMSDLLITNQTLEMSREAGMAVLTLLEARRRDKKEDEASS